MNNRKPVNIDVSYFSISASHFFPISSKCCKLTKLKEHRPLSSIGGKILAGKIGLRLSEVKACQHIYTIIVSSHLLRSWGLSESCSVCYKDVSKSIILLQGQEFRPVITTTRFPRPSI